MRRWQLSILTIGIWLILTYCVLVRWYHGLEQKKTVIKEHHQKGMTLQMIKKEVGDGIEEQYIEILNTAAAVAEEDSSGNMIPQELMCLTSEQLKENSGSSLWFETKGGQRVVAAIHIPKAGGSALTTVLRRFACEANQGKANACCEPPGFCQKAKGKNRLCPVILGCHGHEPTLRNHITRYPKIRAVTVLRDPRSRVVSAWFYRCHNANFDCFNVDGAIPWQIAKRFARSQATERDLTILQNRRNQTFFEYLYLPHYHNIQTRMLGRYASPYALDNPPLTQSDLNSAIHILDTRFALVGVFELFDHVVALLSLLAVVPLKPIDFIRVRATHSPAYHTFVKKLRGLGADFLEDIIRTTDSFDLQLHDYASRRLCSDLARHHLLSKKNRVCNCCANSSDYDTTIRQRAFTFCNKYVSTFDYE
mmetsp:Transcript_17121/g.22207  ORF Transcript_17121/g.22207 Transcript_17121/m.22207 type:complete len:421 (+) Transcript_17121:67-1329(+)